MKGRGDFELIDSHLVPGLPHVSMYADGKSFAALYFGTKVEAREESKLDLHGNSLNSSSPNASKTISTPTPALLAEPPKLQFLEWEEGWKTNHPRSACHRMARP